MKRNLFFTSLSVALAVFSGCSNPDPDELFSPEHVLWYDEPAELWEETLPLGNGRLGMMPDGGVIEERIVLNEISMWSGSEADYSNPDAAESLPEIRQLLLEGRNAESQEVMYERFVPHKPSDGGTYGGYQTLGDLHIDYHTGFSGDCFLELNPSHSCGAGLPGGLKPCCSGTNVHRTFSKGLRDRSQGHGRPWFIDL